MSHVKFVTQLPMIQRLTFSYKAKTRDIANDTTATYRCLSIFEARYILSSRRYILSSRRSTRTRLIQRICCGIRALAVSFLFPVSACQPFLLAMTFLRTRALECTAMGLRIIKPSFTSLPMRPMWSI